MKPKLTDKQAEDKKKKIAADILKVIQENPNIVCIKHIFCKYSGCSRQYFYKLGIDKFDSLKEAIEQNATDAKEEMQTNWRKADASPVLQIAGYKLMADTDERKKLSQTFIESTGPGGGPIQYTDMTEEQRKNRIKELIAKRDE